MPKNIIVPEVGPRDDLQLFRTKVDRQAKIDWCREEAAAGVCEIEVTSFVPASIIPQFNDAAEVAAGFVRCFHCQAWGMPVRANRNEQYQYRRLRVLLKSMGYRTGIDIEKLLTLRNRWDLGFRGSNISAWWPRWPGHLYGRRAPAVIEVAQHFTFLFLTLRLLKHAGTSAVTKMVSELLLVRWKQQVSSTMHRSQLGGPS